MIRIALLGAFATLFAAASPCPAWAQSNSPGDLDLPPALAPWVGWVLHGERDALCPDVGKRRLCAWPAALELDLNASGGSFQLDLYAERETDVMLPGSKDRWPQAVTLDGKPAVVLGGPRVRVPAGRHRLTGELRWPSLPESLETPATVGQVKLRIDGQPIASPRHDGGGLLWLRGNQAGADSTQRLDVEVYRRIEDGVPARVITRLQLAVGGKTREVAIDGALLEGTRAIQLSGSLPARLDPDGTLHVQVAPGEHRVEVTSILPAPPDSLAAPKPQGPWAEREVWVFAADPELREVEPTGPPRIDPARTNLAPDWRDLPTFVLTAGASLGFETRRRGEPEPSPNELSLARELWLDLDGEGYTVRDHLEGPVRRDWRLDLEAGELGRAAVRGQDQLITVHEGARGLEVRDDALDLTAEWRLARDGGALPAVGWSNDMRSVRATLHLPPGWSLLGGEGADSISGTLLDQWDLWSFFFVLLVALASFKLAGPLWGGVALLALALCTHQPDAPEGVWLWLLGALALTRLSLPGAWGTGARVLLGLSLLSAVLTLVPFTVHQLRFALYPQVQDVSGGSWMTTSTDMSRVQEESPMAPTPEMAEQMVEDMAQEEMTDDGMAMPGAAPPPQMNMDMDGRPSRGTAGEGTKRKRVSRPVSGSLSKLGGESDPYRSALAKARKEAQQLDAGAVVQTGPGVPDWSWRSYFVNFDGPVQRGQSLSLWLIPPPVGRLLAVLRVLLAGVLLFGLLRASRGSLKRGGGTGAALATALSVALAGGWLIAGGTAHAQDRAPSAPGGVDPGLLEELRRRLTEPPECAPDCLSSSELEVQVRGADLVLRSEVHAGAVVGFQAPGPVASFTPREVRVDGKPAEALARLEDGFLRVRLEPGRHVVELVGPIPASDELTLQLGTPPRHVSVDAPDFDVDGVRADGKAEGSIQLRRRVQSQGDVEGGTELPPWLLVRRHFDFGSRFRVVTTVERVGRSDAAVLLRFPLLKGESVTQTDMQETEGAALLRLSPGQQQLVFTSALDPREDLTLQAPAAQGEQPYSVVWEVACGTLYHCTAEGLAPVSHRAGGQRLPVYRPFPGESLRWTLKRLPPAEGRSTTIDRADLHLEPGHRLTSANLSLSLRSSTGSSLTVELPEDAELGALTIGGQPRTTQMHAGKLELALEPGHQHIVIAFRVPRGMSTRYVAPPVSVDGEMVNVRVHMQVPQDRWLLWTRGPDWGPAVLFWGFLAAFVLFALGLSRVPHSPLHAHQWLLLALGLTQISVAASLVVVAWFFAVRQRKKRPPTAPWLFNLAQIGLVVLTLAATVVLVDAVHEGLLVRPEMQVAGGDSNDGRLVWYVDRATGALPQPSMISVPLWIYRGLMLAWALWLAAQSLRWLRMGWEAFSEGGRWKMLPRKVLGAPRAAPRDESTAPTPETSGDGAPEDDDA